MTNPRQARSARRQIPFDFVLEQLAPLEPLCKPMFGCTAVYVDDQIVLILRDKPEHPADNGIWLATSHEHHESLRNDFPLMRSIGLLGADPTGWQNLPAEDEGFESAALLACELVLNRDPRIGKVPKARAKRGSKPRSPKVDKKSAATGKAAQKRAASSKAASPAKGRKKSVSGKVAKATTQRRSK